MTAPAAKPDPRGQRAPAAGVATVSAGFVENLLRFAVANGADRTELLARAGLSDGALADPDRRVAFDRYLALMRQARLLCAMPDLALRAGAAGDFREFSVVGLICYAAETMGDALKELNRYNRLIADVQPGDGGQRFRIVEDARGVWLEDTLQASKDSVELTEGTWARFIGETRRHFPGAPFALEVHVPHPPPPYAAAYETVYGAQVVFGSHRNAIRIDPTWLSIPLHNPSRYAFGVLSERADSLMCALQADTTTRGRLEAALLPTLHQGDPGMQHLARCLDMSSRTLRRRLAGEETTYSEVLDDLRRRMAISYLEGGRTSVNETAYLVGFSEASAFSRAFKRWTGRRPRTARPR